MSGAPYTPAQARRILLRLRIEMLAYLGRSEDEARFCGRCRLPLPEGDYDCYSFCPWCCNSLTGCPPCYDEARRVIEREWDDHTDIQCGECGCEYEQPARYPFRFCANCGAPFAAEDEIVVVLPFRV
jgi:hypothetical protein